GLPRGGRPAGPELRRHTDGGDRSVRDGRARRRRRTLELVVDPGERQHLVPGHGRVEDVREQRQRQQRAGDPLRGLRRLSRAHRREEASPTHTPKLSALALAALAIAAATAQAGTPPPSKDAPIAGPTAAPADGKQPDDAATSVITARPKGYVVVRSAP